MIMGFNLVVIGGVFLLSHGLTDRVAAVLILVAGVYAVLWQEPLVLGAADHRLLPVEIAKNGFLFSLSGAIFLWAYWLFERHVELLEETRDALQDAVMEGQVYIDVLGHDIRNPLTIAMNSAELSAQRYPPVREDISRITRNLDRIEDLIDRSILFAKLEASEDIATEPQHVEAMVLESIESLDPLAEDKDLTIETSLQGLTECTAAAIFKQAIENLLSNAIDHSPPGSTITVRTDSGEHTWHLWVRDHGPGIPEGDGAHIFSRFTQGRDGQADGHGLGLAITKRIVDLHEGNLAIETTPGGGCTFRITIPRDWQAQRTNVRHLRATRSSMPVSQGGAIR